MKKIVGLTTVLLTMCVMLCSCNENEAKKKNFFFAGYEDWAAKDCHIGYVGILLDKEAKVINLETGKIADLPLPSENVDEILYTDVELNDEEEFFGRYRIGNKVYAEDYILSPETARYQDSVFELPEEYDQILAGSNSSLYGNCFYYIVKDNKVMLYCHYREGKFRLTLKAGLEVRLVENLVIDLPKRYDSIFPVWGNCGIAIGIARGKDITIIYGDVDDEELLADIHFDKIKLEQKTIRLPDAYDAIIGVGVYADHDMDSLEVAYIQNDRIKVYDIKEEKVTRDVFAGDDFKAKPKKQTAKNSLRDSDC